MTKTVDGIVYKKMPANYVPQVGHIACSVHGAIYTVTGINKATQEMDCIEKHRGTPMGWGHMRHVPSWYWYIPRKKIMVLVN